MLTLRQLEYLVAAADEGTVSGAAHRCRVSQSAVSLALSQLERSLEVQLFVRRRAKGLALTAAGTRVLTDARRVLDLTENLVSDARTQGQQLTGRLVIACTPTLTPHLMPRVLDEFPRRHPDVEVDFVEGSVDEVQEWLLGGACEVAFTYDLTHREGVRFTRLYTCIPEVLVSPEHALARRRKVRLNEFSDEQMIMVATPASEEYYGRLLASAGTEHTVRHRTLNVESARSLVGAGAGYSLLLTHPGSSVPPDPRVVTLPLLDEVGGIDVVLATADQVRLTRRADAFVSFARAAFTPRPRRAGRGEPARESTQDRRNGNLG